jgi:hypothetical protein
LSSFVWNPGGFAAPQDAPALTEGSTQMMTTVRDFLIAHLGGSTFMWDVFLGVLLALLVVFLLRLLIWIASYPFR